MVIGDPQQRITEFFDRHSSNYSEFFAAETRTGAAETFRTRLALVVNALEGRGGRMLDLASGTGEITQAVNLAGDYHQIWVNDISAQMLEIAKANVTSRGGQHVHFKSVDGFSIEDVEGISDLDVILCLGLIAHVGRLDDLFAIFGRLLVPGGVVAMQTTVANHLGVRLSRIVNERRVSAGAINPIHFFRVTDIEQTAKLAGFSKIYEQRFSLALPFGDKLLGPLNFQLEKFAGQRIGKSGGEAVLVFQKDG